MLIAARSFTTTQHLHSYKFTLVNKTVLSALPSCCLLRRTPFSNVVCMCTLSLVPKPKTTVIGLGARLAMLRNGVPATLVSLSTVVSFYVKENQD